MATLKRPRSPTCPSTPSPSKRLRLKATPRRHATFFDLSTDIQVRIFSSLSLVDLHSVRLSGLINSSPGIATSIAAILSDQFKRNLAEIHTVRSMLPDKGYSKERNLPPTEFVKLKKLRIATLPSGYGSVNGNRNRNSAVILKLARLTHLDISKCEQITGDIPANIGKLLPHLKVFNIEKCNFNILPKSLVRTLERNLRRCKGIHSKYTPLVLSPDLFPQGYLRETIDGKKYPKLAAKCEIIFSKNDQVQAAVGEVVQGGEVGGVAEDGDDGQYEDVDLI